MARATWVVSALAGCSFIGRTGCRLYDKSDRTGTRTIYEATMTNGTEP
jgi:hypothetical protein